ncbi:MAG: hypothetical protein RL569_133 [Actinomycetota bacterium]|jgi:uncharacterized membrane protein
MVADKNSQMVDAKLGSQTWRPLSFLLVIAGSIGWLSSTALLIERIRSLQNPQSELACDISPFVSCGALFDRWQASLLGFPNPVIGVAGFMVPVIVGLGVLAGAKFAPWFWRLLVLGFFGSWAFVTWLFVQSTFVIGVLCPYCLVVWAAAIPIWWTTGALTLANGQWGIGATRTIGLALIPYLLPLIIANFALIIVIIVFRFPYLFAV